MNVAVFRLKVRAIEAEVGRRVHEAESLASIEELHLTLKPLRAVGIGSLLADRHWVSAFKCDLRGELLLRLALSGLLLADVVLYHHTLLECRPLIGALDLPPVSKDLVVLSLSVGNNASKPTATVELAHFSFVANSLVDDNIVGGSVLVGVHSVFTFLVPLSVSTPK